MRTPAINPLLFVPGPFLGVSLVFLAFGAGSGPGFLLFSLAAALGFVVFAPLLQVVFSRRRQFMHRPGVACLLALGIVTVALMVASLAPVFNQW
jgi:hypothetical protein